MLLTVPPDRSIQRNIPIIAWAGLAQGSIRYSPYVGEFRLCIHLRAKFLSLIHWKVLRQADSVKEQLAKNYLLTASWFTISSHVTACDSCRKRGTGYRTPPVVRVGRVGERVGKAGVRGMRCGRVVVGSVVGGGLGRRFTSIGAVYLLCAWDHPPCKRSGQRD